MGGVFPQFRRLLMLFYTPVVNIADDGEISPSEAVGVWRESRCVAEGWWNLGSNVGLQHATAHLVDAAGSAGSTEAVVFQAIARQGARLFFGGAWTPREDRWVELVDDGSEPFLREVDPTGIFRPVIGVDFPIWPSWRRIRVAAGAGAREIDRTFYFGVSLLQGLLFGPSQEASAVDLHLGVQLSRRNVGIADPACGPSGLCTRRDLRFSGFTALVTVDGASAFRGLAGAVLR